MTSTAETMLATGRKPAALIGPRTMLCRDLFFEYLAAAGVRYLFGNPGTTELPLVDGCNERSGIRYVMSLHEDIAVAQATGYARASGTIGVVNLHVAPGVAHGLGNLYNAYRARVPLLVTAGQHHTGLKVQDPILTADLAGMVRPFTKWAYEVTLAEELPFVLQRAFKEVMTPPYAPVFVSLPMNLMLEKYEGVLPAQVSRVSGIAAEQSAVDRAAEALAAAENPMILSGDGVGHADAWAEVVAIAERLGARVHTEGYSTLANFPADHPLYLGPISNLPTEMRRAFDDVDVLLMCGVTSQAPVSRYDDGGPLVPWRVRTIAVDDSPAEIGKNQAVEVGLVGDLKRNLARLRGAIDSARVDVSAVSARTEVVRAACAQRAAAWAAKVATARESETISANLIAAELRELFPADAVFVDETISNRSSFVNVLNFADPHAYFSANGLSLGYSAGAAVGIQLALPARRVVNVVGDGSLMYYPQALWNAANLATPVLFVVLNNGAYKVLKLIVERMGGPWDSGNDMPPGLDIDGPQIDFVGLARSLGIAAERATTSAELRAALRRGLDTDTPYLIDAVLEGDRP